MDVEGGDGGSDWNSLPRDVQDKIVANLPFRQAVQFQAVCKAFRGVIHRNTFLQPRQESVHTEGSFSPVIFFIDPSEKWQWLGFDLHSKRWTQLPSLSFLASPDPQLFKEFLIAGSGGLICVNTSKNGQEVHQIIVCNPVSGSMRTLPPLNFPRQPVLMHLLRAKGADNYKVIVFGSSSVEGDPALSRKTEVYDSATSRWEVTGDLPGPEFALNEYQNGAFCDGILYCIGFLDAGDRATRGVLAYHVETGVWLRDWRCLLPSLSCCRNTDTYTQRQLLECGGEVYLYWEQMHNSNTSHSCIAKLQVLVRYLQGMWCMVVHASKSGGRGLLVYPENICVSHGDDKVCIFNTLSHTGSVHNVHAGDSVLPSALPSPLAHGLRPQPGIDKLFFSMNPLSSVFQPSFHSLV